MKQVSKRMAKGDIAVVNTDNSNGEGIHWVLAIKPNNTNNQFLFYDSYGKDVKTYNRYFEELKIIQDTKDREQKYQPYEKNCGQRAIASAMVYDKLGKDAFLKI